VILDKRRHIANYGMIYIGTSGFKYPEWKGSFYPEKISPAAMLPFYAARFNTVEVNFTFYRMPAVELLQRWASDTGPNFKFSFKAPRRITHEAQLRNCATLADDFVRICQTIGEQFGAILFQLPPTFRKDAFLLEEFLRAIPNDSKAAFEFRHESWFSEDVYELLRSRNAALCIAENEKLSTPFVLTADFAYFRLRYEGYQKPDIERWAEKISEGSNGRKVFVYFKHEEKGLGPQFAEQLKAALETEACQPR